MLVVVAVVVAPLAAVTAAASDAAAAWAISYALLPASGGDRVGVGGCVILDGGVGDGGSCVPVVVVTGVGIGSCGCGCGCDGGSCLSADGAAVDSGSDAGGVDGDTVESGGWTSLLMLILAATASDNSSRPEIDIIVLQQLG